MADVLRIPNRALPGKVLCVTGCSPQRRRGRRERQENDNGNSYGNGIFDADKGG
jgi:hypothetical protein